MTDRIFNSDVPEWVDWLREDWRSDSSKGLSSSYLSKQHLQRDVLTDAQGGAHVGKEGERAAVGLRFAKAGQKGEEVRPRVRKAGRGRRGGVTALAK